MTGARGRTHVVALAGTKMACEGHCDGAPSQLRGTPAAASSSLLFTFPSPSLTFSPSSCPLGLGGSKGGAQSASMPNMRNNKPSSLGSVKRSVVGAAHKKSGKGEYAAAGDVGAVDVVG